MGWLEIVCMTVAVACLFPLVWMVASSLKTQSTVFSDMRLWVHHAHWRNYYEAWTRGHFGQYFFNSLLYTAVVVFGVIMDRLDGRLCFFSPAVSRAQFHLYDALFRP